MLGTIASAVAEAAPSADVLSILLTWGPGGVVVLLLITGLLIPKPAHDRALSDRDRLIEAVTSDRDRAVQAIEIEQKAHTLDRESLTAAERRADLILDMGRTTNVLLDALGHSARGDIPRDART